MSANIDDKNKTAEKVTDEYSYTPRVRNNTSRKKTVKKQKAKTNKYAVIIPVAVVVVLLFGTVVLSMTLPKNKIADNVYVCDTDMGGKSKEQAKELVESLIDENTVFSVTSSGKKESIKASDIDLIINVDETVMNAMNIGKSKNIFANAYSAVKLMVNKENVPMAIEYDEDKLDSALFAFGTEINGESTPAQYEFTDDSMTIIPGTPGQNQDTSVARNEFIQSISKGIFDDIAVTLDYAETQKLNADSVYDEVCKTAQEASYEKTDDGKIIVHEHTLGVELDKNDLKNAVEKVNAGEKTTIPAKIITPKKTKEDLEANLFSTTIGSYSTDFSSSTENRAHNVKRAAASINGTILMPGDVFSYNSAIGNPSLANGYKVAPVFENGKTSQGVGGGVCQVSSTLYSAVLYADLSIVERHNHSLTVGYVPKGQDATVSYGSLDFKFKNSTDYPIKISSVVNGRKLTISIIGAKYKPDRKIELSHNVVSTIAPSETVTNDPSLPEGTRKVTSSGKSGYVVDSYKTVYENGVKTSSKKISRSTYKATPAEVVVGTGSGAVSSVDTVPSNSNSTIDNSNFIPVSPNEENTPQQPPEPDNSQNNTGSVVPVIPVEDVVIDE